MGTCGRFALSFFRLAFWCLGSSEFPFPGTSQLFATEASGTEFWLAFEENLAPGSLKIQILGEPNVAGQVMNSSLGLEIPFSVGSSGMTTVDVPLAAMVTIGDGISQQAILVEAGGPVVLYGLNLDVGSSDSFLALPSSQLGTEYYVTTYSAGPGESQFAIVATADGTTVTILPSAAIGAHAAGVPFDVVLNRGQSYQGQSAADLTGTEISADAAVAVFAGNTCAQVPVGTSGCDHLAEQLLPLSAWGSEVVVVPSMGRTAPDRVRLHAAADNSLFLYQPSIAGAPTSLNSNGVSEFSSSQPFVVVSQGSSNPFAVGRFASGTLADGMPGDPFELIELATARFSHGYRLATADDGTQFPTNYLHLVSTAAGVGRIRLDGALVPPACFTVIGTSGFFACRQLVAPGPHRLQGPITFGASIYGVGALEAAVSYGSPAGGASLPFRDGFEEGVTSNWTSTVP